MRPVQHTAAALIELLATCAAAEPAVALGGALGSLRHRLRPTFPDPHSKHRIFAHSSVRGGPIPNRAFVGQGQGCEPGQNLKEEPC